MYKHCVFVLAVLFHHLSALSRSPHSWRIELQGAHLLSRNASCRLNLSEQQCADVFISLRKSPNAMPCDCHHIAAHSNIVTDIFIFSVTSSRNANLVVIFLVHSPVNRVHTKTTCERRRLFVLMCKYQWININKQDNGKLKERRSGERMGTI